MSSEEYNKTLPSKEKYNKTLLSKVDDLKQGLQYYIDRTNQLEQELNYYKRAYENRVEKHYELEQRIYRLDFISKDKIRDKIEELDNQQKQWLEDRKIKNSDGEIIFARDILKELLEEEASK